MPGRNSKRHTHKYYRFEGLWHCALPGCTHYMPSNMPAPVYKDSICWICGQVFQLTPDNMKFVNPTCSNCPEYDIAPVTPIDSDILSDWIERKEIEARMKKLKEGIHTPTTEEIVDEIEIINPTEDE